MPVEGQLERIRRLGDSPIWYGQSAFVRPFGTPARESIVIPRCNVVCARCGKPFEFPVWGGVTCAARIVVLHLGQRKYEVYHEECSPQDVPWVYEQKAQPMLPGMQEEQQEAGR